MNAAWNKKNFVIGKIFVPNKKNFLSGNFCARKIALRFLGVAEPKGFRHVSEAKPQPHPICLWQIGPNQSSALIRVKNPDAAELAERNGIEVVMDRCMMIEHRYLIK